MNKNGGQAFPLIQSENMKGLVEQVGITVRDYFAAKAMQALISNETISYGPWTQLEIEKAFSNTVEASYKMADAMMKERLK